MENISREAQLVPNKQMSPEAQTGLWNAIGAAITTAGSAYAASQYKPPVYNQQTYVNANATYGNPLNALANPKITTTQWIIIGVSLVALIVVIIAFTRKK